MRKVEKVLFILLFLILFMSIYAYGNPNVWYMAIFFGDEEPLYTPDTIIQVIAYALWAAFGFVMGRDIFGDVIERFKG